MTQYSHVFRSSWFHSLENRLRRSPTVIAAYETGFFVTRMLRKEVLRAAFHLRHGLRESRWRQEVIRWQVELPPLACAGDLAAWLRSQGLRFHEGAHAFYLPPQPRLAALAPRPVEFYPPGSGFKILKDLRFPERACYLDRERGVRGLARGRLLGPPASQIVVANYLHALGLGPRAWDLCAWKNGATALTVFVVEDAGEDGPSTAQCDDFLNRLRIIQRQSQLRVLLPRWQRRREFRPPDCNHNLVQPESARKPLYVDFESFGIDDPVAWTAAIFERSKRELDLRECAEPHTRLLEIPRALREDASRRWALLLAELRRAGVELRGRLVLDLACGVGLTLHSALAEGASWAIGWVKAPAARAAQELLFSLGSSRFTLVPADQADSPRAEQIPPHLRSRLPEAIVFCHDSAERERDLLRQIPWRAVVDLPNSRSEPVVQISRSSN